GGAKSGTAKVRRSGLNARTLTPPIDEEGGRGGRGGPLALGAGGPAPSAGAGPGTAASSQAASAPTGPPAEAPDTGAGGAGGAGMAGGPGEAGAAGEAGGGPGGIVQIPIPPKTFDLARAYSIDGWFGDSYVDLIPDRLETAIIIGDAKDSLGAAHIATRLGLETTGVTLPLARNARKITNAAAEPNPILVGRSNDLVQQLVKLGKVRLDDLKPGEGAIQIVQKA